MMIVGFFLALFSLVTLVQGVQYEKPPGIQDDTPFYCFGVFFFAWLSFWAFALAAGRVHF